MVSRAYLNIFKIVFAPIISVLLLFVMHSQGALKNLNIYPLSKSHWSFTPNGFENEIKISKLTSIEFQVPKDLECCSGTYKYKEGNLSKDINFEAIYIPALGGKIHSIKINGIKIDSQYTSNNGDGLLFKLPDFSPKNEFLFELEFSAPRGLFSGLWKGNPVVGGLEDLMKLRDSDVFQQSTLPMVFSVQFFLIAAMFLFLHVAAKSTVSFYGLFSVCLASWSVFYFFLSGYVREIDYSLGSRLHLVARAVAWVGTWALMLSYIQFALPEQSKKISKFMKTGNILGGLLVVFQLAVSAFDETALQWTVFAVTSPIAFCPLLLWRIERIPLLSFGYTAYIFSWIALVGSISDATLVLLRIFGYSNFPSLANRYTFPLLLGASASIYVMHFARVLRRLRQNNQKLKRLNQSALVLSGASFEKESLNEFATSLRKAMKTRRCCIAKMSPELQFIVVGLSGISSEAFGSRINLEKHVFVKLAIESKEPMVGMVDHLNSGRYISQAFAVVPVCVKDQVEYLLLFSDPLNDRSFSKSDLLYMRQFGLIMASSSERIEADHKFKQLIGHLDESLYNFVVGKSKGFVSEIQTSQLRGVGFFDQSSFVKFSHRLSQVQLIQLVDIVKQWAASIIMRHGGRIRSFGGDAYLFDISCINDELPKQTAERLARALWELCESQGNLNRTLMGRGLAPISFRFGGHIGIADEVSLLDLGANVTTIIGNAVNFAQRVQSVAAPATVLVSQEVAELIVETFSTSQSWNDKMKDLDPGLKLYRLDSLKEQLPRVAV